MSNSIASAQEISFFRLNTSNGLSDNLVNTAVRDKNGLLWIGTLEGLNTFDGFTVRKYYREEYPALGNDHISDLLCDGENRIWIRSIQGKITMVDEKRNLVAVPVLDEGQEIGVSYICNTRSRGIIAIFKNKIFALKNNNNKYFFEQLGQEHEHVFVRATIQQAEEVSDTILFTGNNKVCIFDASSTKVLYDFSVPAIIGAALLNKEEILATTGNNRELLRINLSTRQVVKNYGLLNDQNDEPVKGYLRHIRKMNDGRYIMTSGYGGVYIFDATRESIHRYQHEAIDNRSVSANNTYFVYTESSGYVFVTTRSAGLNYFKSGFQPAVYRSAFQETSGGKIFHGFINNITQHTNGNFWLGTQSGVIEWNREKNKTRFHEYGEINGIPITGTEEVRTICFDKNDHVWLGLNRFGIVVLDRNRKVVKYLDADSSKSENHLPGNFINKIVMAPDNKLWVATAYGLCIINPDGYTIEKNSTHPLLKLLSRVSTINIWFRNNDEVWVGTTNGAYRFRQSTGEIMIFDTTNGLSRNSVNSFTDDNMGNVYIGSSNGLNVVKENKIVKIYNRSNGLHSSRCFGLLKDRNGYIWIANDNALLSYNPADSSFTFYDESYGLSPSGFRLLSYYQSGNGEQFWGSDEGLSYFFPDQLKHLKIPIQVKINSFTAGNKTYSFSSSEKIGVPYSQHNLLFSFSAIDLFSSKNIVYEYKLEGSDAAWKKTNAPQQVAYSNLSPGKYTFLVRASNDGVNWTEAFNPLSVNIQKPWWRTTGFVIFYGLALVASIYYFIRSRNRKIQQHKEQLEREQVINYFATSMTGHRSVEDTLWDVAKNCIGRLGFEDCVIYLKDEKRNVLVQKAAWGPKTTLENKILNPLEIHMDQGIVGHVARTGIAEIINDTSKDERYIVDDEKRFSEITVPIISDGKVLGVIDSEHPRKNFFTPKQLSILTTIASICANKIVRARVEEEKQEAEKNLLETKRQTAEMEMQALRAQMNPHFLFNCLNSINNFILKNDPDNASQYLTSFSRLMRLILDNSREDWVLLENEIKALQLYVDLEAIRFDNVFTYTIRIAPEVDTGSVMVPPMIVQPYIENAIWHGLLHRKEPGSKLEIDIWKQNGYLCIKVEDNGVGREEAKRLKSKFSSHKQSHGMMITAKRLEIVNTIYDVGATVEIDDRENGKGMAAGTSVLLRLKYKQNHSPK